MSSSYTNYAIESVSALHNVIDIDTEKQWSYNETLRDTKVLLFIMIKFCYLFPHTVFYWGNKCLNNCKDAFITIQKQAHILLYIDGFAPRPHNIYFF